MLHIYLQKVKIFLVSLNKKYSIKILPYGKEIENILGSENTAQN